MVQFTDIHLGEGEQKDRDTQKLLLDIIAAENPDLVVVTGDVISGYAWDKKTRPWGEIQYRKFADTMTKAGVRWALTAGNHDEDADLSR